MIIKSRDSIDHVVLELESYLKDDRFSDTEKEKIKKDIANIRSGQRNEDQSAYLINVDYSNSSNWAVIHDLRIESNGFFAQIDHLIISRTLEFYILESKSFFNGIKITENGEFLRYEFGKYIPFSSPIEQNRRHIKILESFISEKHVMPTRLGFTMVPTFKSLIIVNTSAQIFRPKQGFDTSSVIKADQIATTINTEKIGVLQATSFVSKIVSSSTLKELALKIASYHQPNHEIMVSKYRNKLAKSDLKKSQVMTKPETVVGTKEVKNDDTDENPSAPRCDGCGKQISEKTVEFCKFRHKYYENKTYCVSCQKKFSHEKKK